MANKYTSARLSNDNYTPLSSTILDVYSKELLFHAQPVLRFAQFAVKKQDLSVTPGLTVNMLTYNNLELGKKLEEGTAIETQALSTSQVQIPVYEYGNAIAVTELLLQASFDDVMNSGAKLLGLDYKQLTLFFGRKLSVAKFLWWRKTSDELNADNAFDSEAIKNAVVLATNNAAKYNNDYYVCFIHPHQARTIRDDFEFMNVTEYGKQYAGEIGRIHDVIFIETTQVKTAQVTPDGGDPFTKYQAVMFGENAYGFAEALPVEMRDGGIEDFGRIHKLAWYSIFGAGILMDDNIVRIETR